MKEPSTNFLIISKKNLLVFSSNRCLIQSLWNNLHFKAVCHKLSIEKLYLSFSDFLRNQTRNEDILKSDLQKERVWQMVVMFDFVCLKGHQFKDLNKQQFPPECLCPFSLEVVLIFAANTRADDGPFHSTFQGIKSFYGKIFLCKWFRTKYWDLRSTTTEQ